MLGSSEITWNLASTKLWLAQTQVGDGIGASAFSGSRFLVTLVAGIVLAFALQLVLTNFSIALGISALGMHSNSDSESSDDDSGSLGGTIKKIGFGVGLWTLISVTLSLFVGSLLGVFLGFWGAIPSEAYGATMGLIIWAVYFIVIYVVSSTTVGSIVGSVVSSVVNTATATFQAIAGTAAAAIGGKAVNDQVVATAEAAAAAVGRQLRSAVDPVSLKENLEDYLGSLRRPDLDLRGIRNDFESLLSDPELRSPEMKDRLRSIDRQSFEGLVSSRTDLSKREIARVVDQLEAAWRQALGQQPQTDAASELLNYLKSANPQQLRSNDLNTKLDQLLTELRGRHQSDEPKQAPGLMAQARQFAVSSLMGAVLGRTDLSDLDVEKILGQLQVLRGQATEKLSGTPSGTVATDVENHLLNAYSWKLNRASVETDFREVLYDPEADPGVVRAQLEQLNRRRFVELLNQRGDLTPDRVAGIADQLEGIRVDVLTQVRALELQNRASDLRREVEQYLTTANRDELFTANDLQPKFRAILNDPDTDFEPLRDRLSQFDRNTLVALLGQRQDLNSEEANQVANHLEESRAQVLREAEEIHYRAKSEAEAVQIRVESYLRNTGRDELNPQAIERELKLLLDDPKAGAAALRSRVAHFDRATLVQLLSQRQDLSEAQINQTIDQFETVRDSILLAPQRLANRAQDQYDQVTSQIANYLRNTGKEELNPDGIKRDLQTLLQDPKQGAQALRSRLAQVDRDTLVQLLSQRQDLSQEQANQIIDQVQETLRSVIRAPRRLASRARTRAVEFQTELETYLSNTGKEELSPDGIKRDLQLLLSDPRAGAYSLGERLGSVDRSTVVALLAQRPDISEEEANRIVDQIESVRNQLVEQVRSIQSRIQSTIDRVFERIRTYLNSLDRPELNYDGIKRDLRTLFDDPQAGFDALRTRLSEFDRDTLVALISSREDISEADANRLIDQVEGARNSVLQRAERLNQEAQRRMEALKLQAQRQAEETRKAAAAAAWWLLGTALISAAASAYAGVLAV